MDSLDNGSWELLEATAREFLGPPFSGLPGTRRETPVIPVARVGETASEYLVRVSLPQMRKHDVKVIVYPNSASIWGLKQTQTPRQTSAGGFTERQFEEFKRIVSFSSEVDVAGAKAHWENGVLELRVPKKKAGARLVKIE